MAGERPQIDEVDPNMTLGQALAEFEGNPPLLPPTRLRILYLKEGTNDAMAHRVISGVVRELVEFGVNPDDIRSHLANQINVINEGIK